MLPHLTKSGKEKNQITTDMCTIPANNLFFTLEIWYAHFIANSNATSIKMLWCDLLTCLFVFGTLPELAGKLEL